MRLVRELILFRKLEFKFLRLLVICRDTILDYLFFLCFKINFIEMSFLFDILHSFKVHHSVSTPVKPLPQSHRTFLSLFKISSCPLFFLSLSLYRWTHLTTSCFFITVFFFCLFQTFIKIESQSYVWHLTLNVCF